MSNNVSALLYHFVIMSFIIIMYELFHTCIHYLYIYFKKGFKITTKYFLKIKYRIVKVKTSRRMRQKYGHVFKASLGYIMTSRLACATK